jgi:hypothetical protein
MYVDILFGRERPEPGWYLQAIGRGGKRNSTYRVVSAREVKRRDTKARPRITMEVEDVDEIPEGAKVFEFTWYPRKRKSQTFERELAASIQRRLNAL